MPRTLIATGTPRALLVGCSSAAQTGRHVYVAGIAATGPHGRIAGPGDLYAQTRRMLRNIEQALQRAGASLARMVRTHTCVADISRREEVGRAQGELFRDLRPASTMVEVSALVSPEGLIEIEAGTHVDD